VAGGEVGVALVVVPGDLGQAAQLGARQHAIGHGDPEHGRMALDVEAILQAQGAEFIVRKFPGFPAADLVAELGNPFLDEGVIVLVVTVHKGLGITFNGQ